jgi:dTDP-4-dehydrorhamnose 3,5-epimerase-like enzyme
MKRRDPILLGVWELPTQVFLDAPCFFMKTSSQTRFAELGIFVHAHHPFSFRDTLRGPHSQLRHPRAKLCRRALHGKTSSFSKPAEIPFQFILWYAVS